MLRFLTSHLLMKKFTRGRAFYLPPANGGLNGQCCSSTSGKKESRKMIKRAPHLIGCSIDTETIPLEHIVKVLPIGGCSALRSLLKAISNRPTFKQARRVGKLSHCVTASLAMFRHSDDRFSRPATRRPNPSRLWHPTTFKLRIYQIHI